MSGQPLREAVIQGVLLLGDRAVQDGRLRELNKELREGRVN
jgi:hypothetical protein